MKRQGIIGLRIPALLLTDTREICAKLVGKSVIIPGGMAPVIQPISVYSMMLHELLDLTSFISMAKCTEMHKFKLNVIDLRFQNSDSVPKLPHSINLRFASDITVIT